MSEVSWSSLYSTLGTVNAAITIKAPRTLNAPSTLTDTLSAPSASGMSNNQLPVNSESEMDSAIVADVHLTTVMATSTTKKEMYSTAKKETDSMAKTDSKAKKETDSMAKTDSKAKKETDSTAKKETASAATAAVSIAKAAAAAEIVNVEHHPTNTQKIETVAPEDTSLDSSRLQNDPHRSRKEVSAVSLSVNRTGVPASFISRTDAPASSVRTAIPSKMGPASLSQVNRSISWAADPKAPGRMTVLTYFEWMERNQSVIRILPFDATCKRTSDLKHHTVDVKPAGLGTLDRWGVVWDDLASVAIKRSQEINAAVPAYWTCMYDHWTEQKAFFTRYAPSFAHSATLGRHSWTCVQCLPASQLLLYLTAQSQTPIYAFTTEMINALRNLEKEIVWKFPVLTATDIAQSSRIIREVQLEAERARQSQLETEMARKNQSRILLRDRARRAKIVSTQWLMKMLEAAASAAALQPAAPVTSLPATAAEFRTTVTSLISQAIPYAYWDESDSDSKRVIPIVKTEVGVTMPLMSERGAGPTTWTGTLPSIGSVPLPRAPVPTEGTRLFWPLAPLTFHTPSSSDLKSSSSRATNGNSLAGTNNGTAATSLWFAQPLPVATTVTSIWGYNNKPNAPTIQSHPPSIPNAVVPDSTTNKRRKIDEPSSSAAREK